MVLNYILVGCPCVAFGLLVLVPPAKNGCVADNEQPVCMKVFSLLSLYLRYFDDFIEDNYCIVAHLEQLR